MTSAGDEGTSEGAVELALPFVVRTERAAPPEHTDALEAAARAVLVILTADVADWAGRMAAWDGQRIRKVVRRARGVHWQRAQDLPGLDVVHRSAQVRVFPPVPVDDWPPDLARLQVGGTDFVDSAAPADPDPGTPMILLSPLAEMTSGKAMAQSAHAAQLGWRSLPVDARLRWERAGFPLVVRTATLPAWRSALDAGAPVVHDGGFTEVVPGTATALFTVA